MSFASSLSVDRSGVMGDGVLFLVKCSSMCAVNSSLLLNEVLKQTGHAGVSLPTVATSDCEAAPFAGLRREMKVSVTTDRS